MSDKPTENDGGQHVWAPGPPPFARVGGLAGTISRNADANQLPFWLVCAVITQESEFDRNSCSECGALGLMQIMPSSVPKFSREELLDPDTNIRIGCRMLAELRDTFKQESGDERLKFALTSYNGGIGYVLNAQAMAMRQGLDPAKWTSIREMLPFTKLYYGGRWRTPDHKQIIDYVERIWARYEAWRNAAIPA